MSFKPELKPAYLEAIWPALTEVGYKCERMDMQEHTDPIDDKMMADIRRAKFLVVDLPEHRQNVYFEAGFALGLGKKVIWLIRADQMDTNHFDVRQYNFIDWKADDLPARKERLKNRILGSSGLGQGPVPVGSKESD
jgi:nucleoside 2-deoxyribosyltransferase